MREFLSRTDSGEYQKLDAGSKDMLDRMQHRLDARPALAMFHPFSAEPSLGLLKAWMRSTHFLTKTLLKVRTEKKFV